MSKLVLTNVRLFVGGADLTSNSNSVELEMEAEDVEVTNYGSGGWKESLQGLISTTLTGSGQWEAGDPTKVDNAVWSELDSGAISPWTVCPTGAVDGAVSYFTQAVNTSYTLLGEVGSVAPWEANAVGSWPIQRGRVAHPPGTARTTDGAGTGYQLGAVESGEHLYASLHVLSVAGTSPTLDVVIESDEDNTFSDPTTRLTFSQVTGTGGEILRTAGQITDTWYRVKWTIGGTTPSFLFLVSFQVG